MVVRRIDDFDIGNRQRRLPLDDAQLSASECRQRCRRGRPEPQLDARRAADDVVAAARELLRRAPDLRTLLLECTNMPPHARQVAEATGCRVLSLRDHPVLRVNPAQPQANMLHVHLPVDRERALAIRRELARDHGIWPFNRVSHGMLPDTSFFEIYVGDNLLDTPDGRVREAVALLAGAVERGME